ncbi:MAG: hypothetical protein K2W88_12420, partial [Pararheinheimera sp.]|nr:hypothetical protein [Rheinheimera sp.]
MTVHSKENTSNKVVDAGFFADLSRMEVLLQNNADIPFLKISNLIDSFADNFGMSSLRENSSLEPFLIQSYTRIATVLTNWLVFCEYDFDEHTLYYLSYRSEEFNKIFSVSGYRGFSHVINYMASENPDGSINISGVKLAYLLAILPLDELTDELFAAVDSLTEWQKSIVILGWLQSRSVLRVSGEKYRGLLLDNLDFLKRVTPNYQMLRSFLNAWMNCSYAVSKGKHK